MTKEELEKEAEEKCAKYKLVEMETYEVEAYIEGAEPREKRIAELEEQISVLLSCKNCPDNKGGFICQKEYEDKCLAQKIQYIKELLEENSELKEKLNFSTQYYRGEKAREQLTKAKEIILKLYNAGRDVLMCRAEEKAYDNLSEAISDRSIEQFLSEVGHD